MKNFPKLVGVIHLPPLGGSPGAHAAGMNVGEALAHAGEVAVHEAMQLEKAGFQGIILENFGDAPFFKERVSAETLASMAVIAAGVRQATDLPLGINVLRNDAHSALAIAAACFCNFIRVNVLSGVAATDQGMVEGQAAALLRERDRLHADVKIFADVHVKHARSLSSDDIEIAIEETALRGGADAVILTGKTTGREVDFDELEKASRLLKSARIPLYIGSGANDESLPVAMKYANGVIVGSFLRKNGQAGAPLDSARIKKFVSAFVFKEKSQKKQKPRK